jgi:tetratricopeptide (TPR) repeat protein
LQDQLDNLPGATAVRRFTVDTGLEYLRALEKESAGNADLLRELALAYRKLGDVQGYPLASNLGDGAGAEKSYREAIRILAATPGADAELIEAHRRMGELLDHRGDSAGAIASYRLGEAAAVEALARNSGDRSAMRAEGNLRTSLGRTLFRRGDVNGLAREAARASVLFEQLATGLPGDGEIEDSLATSYRLAATALESSGKWEEAFPYYVKNVEVRGRRVRQEPDNVGLKRQLMLAHSFVGDFLIHQLATPYDPARALDSYQAMLKIAEAQAQQDAKDHKAKLDLALSLLRVGKALALSRDFSRALDYLDKSLALTRQLLEKEPESFVLTLNLTHLIERRSYVLSALNRPKEALTSSREAVRAAERLIRREPGRSEALSEAMASYRTHLNLVLMTTDTAIARNAVRKLEEISTSAAALPGSEPGLVSNLARTFSAIAEAKEKLDGGSGSCVWVRKSAEQWQQLLSAGHKGIVVTTEQPIVAAKLAACP